MIEYRLRPCLLTGNKRSWQVEHKDSKQEYWNILAWVNSIKAGKAVVAHMRRDPIAIE